VPGRDDPRPLGEKPSRAKVAQKEKGLTPFLTQVLDFIGAAGRIRTHDPLVKNQVAQKSRKKKKDSRHF
jgi:hypothetical protein